MATVEVIMNRLLRTRLSVRAIWTYERARLIGTTNAVIVPFSIPATSNI